MLLRRHVRPSKYDPLVEEVELLEANPQFAHVRFQDGKESTVSIRDLAPCGDAQVSDQSAGEGSTDAGGPVAPSPVEGFREPQTRNREQDTSYARESHGRASPPLEPSQTIQSRSAADEPLSPPTVRRSSRARRAPDRLDL